MQSRERFLGDSSSPTWLSSVLGNCGLPTRGRGPQHMRILDVTCPHCWAMYQVAISDSTIGGPGRFECQVCAEVADRWEDHRLRAHRLVATSNGFKPAPLV
jgi:hypothetical protein